MSSSSLASPFEGKWRSTERPFIGYPEVQLLFLIFEFFLLKTKRPFGQHRNILSNAHHQDAKLCEPEVASNCFCKTFWDLQWPMEWWVAAQRDWKQPLGTQKFFAIEHGVETHCGGQGVLQQAKVWEPLCKRIVCKLSGPEEFPYHIGCHLCSLWRKSPKLFSVRAAPEVAWLTAQSLS